MKKHRWGLSALAAGSLAIAALAGCGDSSDSDGGSAAATTTTGGGSAAADVSGSVSIAGVWTGVEQRNFQAVIDAFNEQYPDVTIRYQPAGDNLPTVLSTAVQGGNPPDLAAIAQPGLIREFQAKGALKPLDFAQETLDANYPADFIKLGTIDDQVYSFLFKGANKSTVWYNVAAFEAAGVEAPATFDDFTAAARTIKASGVPAYSLGGADGWTLTDLFENVYLRQAGGDKYDQLTAHEIKWTDPSVKEALRTMAAILGDTDNIAGGTTGALQTDFPTSVSNVFSDSPRAAVVIEGDFVPGVVAGKSKLRAETGYNAFPFPAIGDASNAVVGGGDSIAVFNDTPAVEAFVNFLASPEGASVWVKLGGFSTPNRSVDPADYPDAITKTVAEPLANAETFRFDMSDLAPAAFGGTPGQGEWKILQDFLKNPGDVDGTASKLEAAAAKAYKG